MKPSISIIIPVLNEAERITNLLSDLKVKFPDAEIIVSDGGSSDGTADLAQEHANVITSRKGRSFQMNAGADASGGDVLWFLHADCDPPAKAVELIRSAINDGNIGGGFRWELDGDKWYYPVITWISHRKNKIKRNLYGDMGIFVRRDVFETLEGYKEIPLMEEVEFNDRLIHLGNTILFDTPIVSSDRRLLKSGPIRSFIRNSAIKIAYNWGVSAETLAKYYR